MRRDPHSYADDTQAEVVHFDWRARFDFAARVIAAEARLRLRAPATAGPLDLDTRDLSIEAVSDEAGQPLAWQLDGAEPILGARLRVQLPAGTRELAIRYRTSPAASALQWLEPAQTAGRQHPFVFSQCQAIHARSIVPLPDTPRLRLTYSAELDVPAPLTALMAAGGQAGRWHMPQPIPPYLFAFAVGDVASAPLSPRSSVWAEPALLARAAFEFADAERMLATAEELFGPYDWERFDLLVLPPSFPYGGMENPRLTFLTPTLLAGDRSLVSVLAHELAHSWTGNLVSNASAEHFWLNEGMTVFAERRIVARLYGAETAALQSAVGFCDLEKAITRFKDKPELTRLHTRLDGIDPDESFSEVPYEKGFLFLRALEEAVGRDAFDRFLKAWVEQFRFGAVTTDDFCAAVERALPGALARVDAPAWLEGAGLPAGAPRPRSQKLEAITALGVGLPSEAQGRAWSPTEWQLYLESLPVPASRELCAELERRFALTASGNYEVLVAWLTVALHASHDAVLPRVEEVLASVGRMKYLRPLYAALVARKETRPVAERIYKARREAVHPIARQLIEGLLAAGAP
jgi:aminopeptidase N